jgi:hypothetical protein
VLQNVALRIDLAFKAFFRRVKVGEAPGYPRFRGKGRYNSLTLPRAKARGCSGTAHGAPSRARLRGLPGPSGTVRRSARRARLTTTAGSSAAPRVQDAFRLFPTGTASRGAPTPACRWQGADVRQRSSPALARQRHANRTRTGSEQEANRKRTGSALSPWLRPGACAPKEKVTFPQVPVWR